MKIPKIRDFFAALSSRSEATESVDSLEASICELADAKQAATQESIEVRAQRRETLLDENDEAIGRADRRLATLALFQEKCDLALPDLEKRLLAAKEAKRQAQWREYGARYAEEREKEVLLHRQLLAQRKITLQIWNEAARAGFAPQLKDFGPSQPILDESSLRSIQSMIDQIRAGGFFLRPAPAAPPIPFQPFSHLPPSAMEKEKESHLPRNQFGDFVPFYGTPPKEPRLNNQAKSPTPPPVAQKKEPRKPIRETAAEGEVLVEVLRGVYSSPKSGLCAAGDIVALPMDMARMAVMSGNLEFYPPPARETQAAKKG
jgi:hypothetical protein